ncbi:DUF1214 domain-containing protein [Lysobacter sp. HX-5-24]|uniref:DUF1214 domain-containing protein n=2 Tax=Noviluteimonas gilva TaxID=2682097 RepID=A0A7C9HNM3_9GAMM|nr:DUF1214 domain-containing protein [Lysobacter gilvus]
MSCLIALAFVPAACNRSSTETTPAAASTAPSPAAAAVAKAAAYTDQDISDAWIYLLGRLLVLRQQKADLAEGWKWNTMIHRKPGAVDWPNPNLDVAYSEAWVAVDENNCTLVTVPKVTGRYYTVQFLNGWGETVANINERTQAAHPSGEFAVCLQGANVKLPANTTRIDVPVKYMRVLARVELGDNWDEAVALQHKFSMRSTGAPTPPTLPAFPDFDVQHLPGVEAFESAPAVLDSEKDINAGMEGLEAKARAIAEGIRDPAERARVEKVVREKAQADLAKAGALIGHGTTKNGWVRPHAAGTYGDDWLGRTLVNLGGIWANRLDEVIYYKSSMDGDGVQLNGDHVYTLTFPKDALPPTFANYFWSVIAVDPIHARVLPNPKNRFLLNRESGLKYGDDGSLTLYFAAEKPADAPDSNWLPTPKGKDYRLTFRFYGPKGGVADGTYFPPPLVKRS